MNNHQSAGREPFRVIKGLLLGYLASASPPWSR